MDKLGKLIDSYITTATADSIGHDEVQEAFETQEKFANGTLFTSSDFEMISPATEKTVFDPPDSQKTLRLEEGGMRDEDTIVVDKTFFQNCLEGRLSILQTKTAGASPSWTGTSAC